VETRLAPRVVFGHATLSVNKADLHGAKTPSSPRLHHEKADKTGMNRGNSIAAYRVLRLPACRFHFCAFLGQPTSQITDLVIPLHLRQ